MEWYNVLLGALASVFAGLNIFQLVSFRAYKKMHQAQAEQGKAEAEESKQSAMERRLSAVEKMYEEQGKVIDSLRSQVLQLSTEKFESQKRIVLLEGENKTLTEKVNRLEKELQAYKVIAENK